MQSTSQATLFLENWSRLALREERAVSDQEAESFVAKFKRRLDKEFFSIESNKALTPEQKVDRLIFTTGALCAAIAIQPIPFADFFILTPLQGYMGYKIGKVRGIDLTQEKATEVVKYLIGTLGLGFAAQQTVIGLWKLGVPGAGGFMTIPIVFGLTYGIGRAMDVYSN
jgi:uncharacterized protein (DUF697 family)